jgi:hypothetical protein
MEDETHRTGSGLQREGGADRQLELDVTQWPFGPEQADLQPRTEFEGRFEPRHALAHLDAAARYRRRHGQADVQTEPLGFQQVPANAVAIRTQKVSTISKIGQWQHIATAFVGAPVGRQRDGGQTHARLPQWRLTGGGTGSASRRHQACRDAKAKFLCSLHDSTPAGRLALPAPETFWPPRPSFSLVNNVPRGDHSPRGDNNKHEPILHLLHGRSRVPPVALACPGLLSEIGLPGPRG